MTHYAISDDLETVRFECDATPDALCRWECDCDTWYVKRDAFGVPWHVQPDNSKRSGTRWLHQMKPTECTILPWLDGQLCGPVTAGDLEEYRYGRHEIDLELLGPEEGWDWYYAIESCAVRHVTTPCDPMCHSCLGVPLNEGAS